MKIRQFVVDAFASRLFEGNPAAVCPLEQALDETVMQNIACENNLSETAFLVPNGQGYDLRWFTPVAEVDLCGHATLASAHVLFQHLGCTTEEIRFSTRSGELVVRRQDAPHGQSTSLEMLFPASIPQPCTTPTVLVEGLGLAPEAVLAAEDYLVVYPDEANIRNLHPNFATLAQLDLRGVIVTAPGDHCDFVSRFFAPRLGIDEDPVTGSAHCQLAPYWAQRLGKQTLHAVQISSRRGEVGCEVKGDKVVLRGTAVTYLEGVLYL